MSIHNYVICEVITPTRPEFSRQFEIIKKYNRITPNLRPLSQALENKRMSQGKQLDREYTSSTYMEHFMSSKT